MSFNRCKAGAVTICAGLHIFSTSCSASQVVGEELTPVAPPFLSSWFGGCKCINVKVFVSVCTLLSGLSRQY